MVPISRFPMDAGPWTGVYDGWTGRCSEFFLVIKPTVKQSIADLDRHLANRPPSRLWFGLLAMFISAGLFYLLIEIFYFGSRPLEWRGSSAFSAIARNLAHNWQYSVDGIHPTAGRSPLYPILISFSIRLGGDYWFALALAVQLLCYVGCGMVTAHLAFRLTGDRFTCLLVGALYISHLPFGAESMTQRETILFSLLVTSCFLLLTAPDGRRKYLLLGVLSALLYLTRSTGFLMVLLLPLLVLPRIWQEGWGRRAVYLGLALGTFGVITLPWHLYLMRNYGNLELIPGSTSGENLFKGSTPELDEIYPLVDVDLLNPIIGEYTSGLNEVERNRWLMRKGKDFIWDDLVQTAHRVAIKFGAFYSPVKTPYGSGSLVRKNGELVLIDFQFNWLNVAGTPHTLLIFLGSAILLRQWKQLNREQQSAIIQILAWIIVLTGAHLMTFGETRHRLPLDLFFILFTAMAIAPWIRDRFSGNRLQGIQSDGKEA
jgi:4-amino-4-deoxy-L-arabinose transferase-like glycosyltransferase